MLDTSCFFVKARVFLAMLICAAPFCSSRSPRKGKRFISSVYRFRKENSPKAGPGRPILAKTGANFEGSPFAMESTRKGYSFGQFPNFLDKIPNIQFR